MYSTYDQYQEQGGPLNEARYRVLAGRTPRASSTIERSIVQAPHRLKCSLAWASQSATGRDP